MCQSHSGLFSSTCLLPSASLQGCNHFMRATLTLTRSKSELHIDEYTIYHKEHQTLLSLKPTPPGLMHQSGLSSQGRLHAQLQGQLVKHKEWQARHCLRRHARSGEHASSERHHPSLMGGSPVSKLLATACNVSTVIVCCPCRFCQGKPAPPSRH